MFKKFLSWFGLGKKDEKLSEAFDDEVNETGEPIQYKEGDRASCRNSMSIFWKSGSILTLGLYNQGGDELFEVMHVDGKEIGCPQWISSENLVEYADA